MSTRDEINTQSGPYGDAIYAAVDKLVRRVNEALEVPNG